MAVGRTVTRSDLDNAVGKALADVNRSLQEANRLRDDYLRGKTAAEITAALGYDQESDVVKLLAAMNDMDLLFKIYKGAQPLAAVYDFRDNAKDLWGLGV